MSNTRPPRTFSCAECRRLKLKCNRQWPCTECVRRGTGHLCPNATSAHGPSKARQIVELQGRIRQLETLLGQTVGPVSPTSGTGALGNTSLDSVSSDSPVSSSREKHPVIGGPTSSTVDSVGQLRWKIGGNSRFFGVTAAEHRLAMATENEEGGSSRVLRTSHAPTDWPLQSTESTSPGTKIDELKRYLPSRTDVHAAVERYWEYTLWRFEPFTKTFLDLVLDEVFPSRADCPRPHPHRLALVFAVLALSELFNSDISSRQRASTYHDCTRSALAIGNFMSDVSIASLCALHLICGYILNAEGTLDELYVLVGLGVRLAISAGLHRDGSWWDIEQPDLDDRRRIWWELTQLERVHSFTLGLPMTLPTGCDTAKPSTLSPISFLFWKWELLVLVSKVNESANTGRDQSYTEILAADGELRAYDANLPIHLRCGSAPLWRKKSATILDPPSLEAYEQGPVLGYEGLPHLLAVQQLRLAQLYNMSLFHLHRSSFTTALRGESEPLDGPLARSVLALIVETSGNLISLISALFEMAPAFAHFGSNSLELFNVLACQAALLIRRPHCVLKEHCRRHMESALDLIQRVYDERPSHRLEVLLQKSRKLKAETVAALMKANPVSSCDAVSGVVQSQEASDISDVDFDTWLSQILRGDELV